MSRRSMQTLLAFAAAACALLPLGPVHAQSSPQSQPPPAPPAMPDHPAIEPAAVELLQATSKHLASLSSMSFTAVSTFEAMARTGQPLYYLTQSDVTVQHPNKLRVVTPGDGPASQFYYDGKTMSAYAPVGNFTAVADAPLTMDGMLLAAHDKAAICFPFATLLSPDPCKGISDGLTSAFVVGQSHVGAVRKRKLP